VGVAVQGSFYQDLVDAIASAERREREAPTPAQRQSASERRATLSTIALVIVLYTVASEIIAIVALYQQHGNDVLGFFVLGATIFMILAAAAPPTVVLGRWLLSPSPALRHKPDARPGYVTRAGEPEPYTAMPPEAGKRAIESETDRNVRGT
jgi:hypothetical protein